jgi:hypothetical protein
MLKLYTAFTEEIDDPQAAARDILAQLNPAANMRANTIGMIFFHYDFAEDGILQEFAEMLPFELVGCVSNYTGANGAYGDFAVTVTMFTADDVRFRVDTVEDMDTKQNLELRDEFYALCADLHDLSKNKGKGEIPEIPEIPKLVLAFIPPYSHYSIDDLLLAVDSVENSAMFFGNSAFNLDGVAGTNYVLGNGKLSGAMCTFLSFYGELSPKFHITGSYDMSGSFGEEVTITDYNTASLKTVNNIPVLDYLYNKGLLSRNSSAVGAGITAIPAAITYTYGIKSTCALLGVEKDGSILTARSLEKGAKIVFSQLDDSKTLQGIKDTIYNIKWNKHSEFIVFSGAARAWAFGANYFTELKAFADAAHSDNEPPLTYSMAYSGGEICPIPQEGYSYEDDHPLRNMIHNYTLVACSFS